MNKEKNIFWSHKYLGTHTVLALSKKISIFFTNRELYSNIYGHSLTFISAKKIFCAIVSMIFKSSVLHVHTKKFH